MTSKQLAELREQFIEERRELLSKRVDTMQARLLSAILEKIIDKLESVEGNLKPTLKNITIAAAIDEVYDNFNANQSTINQLRKDLQELNRFNLRYFSAEVGGVAAKRANKSIVSILNRNIGLTKAGKLRRNGYLQRISSDERLRQEIKDVIFSAITSNQPFAQAKTTLKDVIAGNNEYKGGLQRHYRTLIYDSYQQVDRQNQVLFANKLGLKAFIYGGTTVRDSRDFCKKRVGKVFLIDEAKEWSKLKWQGKNRSYNPMTDLGGYQCLHHPDFVGNETAMSLRDDLEIVKGELVSK